MENEGPYFLGKCTDINIHIRIYPSIFHGAFGHSQVDQRNFKKKSSSDRCFLPRNISDELFYVVVSKIFKDVLFSPLEPGHDSQFD